MTGSACPPSRAACWMVGTARERLCPPSKFSGTCWRLRHPTPIPCYWWTIMRQAHIPQIAPLDIRRYRTGAAGAGARRDGGPRHHAGEQPQALPACPRHPAQRRRGRGCRAGGLRPRLHASGKLSRRFQPVDMAVADRHERGAGPAAPPAARRGTGLAAARRARSRDHPVPPRRRRRSGKIHGPA